MYADRVPRSASECLYVPPSATECLRVPLSASDSLPHQVLHPYEAKALLAALLELASPAFPAVCQLPVPSAAPPADPHAPRQLRSSTRRERQAPSSAQHGARPVVPLLVRVFALAASAARAVLAHAG